MSSRAIISSQFIYDDTPAIPSCHASTIVETERGLLAAWFGGSKEGEADVCIWTSRFIDGQWREPAKVADGGGLPTWNPVLFQPRGGPVMLFYKVGKNPHSWWGMVKTSNDQGQTWNEAARLPDGILGPIKNKPVQLAGRGETGGDIISPTSVELGEEQGWRVYFERSTDGGHTWNATPHVKAPAGVNAIQPSILVHTSSSLQALGRTKSGKMFQVWSEDAGRTWGELALMDLPNCNSGTDAVTLRDGRHVLVYNHSAINKVRYPLNLAISDDGKHWDAAAVIESKPPGQYSYPAIIQTRDGMLHITYTWKRLKIRHVVVDPNRLARVPILQGVWPEKPAL